MDRGGVGSARACGLEIGVPAVEVGALCSATLGDCSGDGIASAAWFRMSVTSGGSSGVELSCSRSIGSSVIARGDAFKALSKACHAGPEAALVVLSGRLVIGVAGVVAA